MRIFALVVAGVVLAGCASDRAAYSAKVSADYDAIFDPAAKEWVACGGSFSRNFRNKTTDAAALDSALSAYCGKAEGSIYAAALQYSQKYPGATPAHMRIHADIIIADFHKATVGLIIARQLQGL